MKERTETIGATRLLWSLAIGLGLALALLWAVMPGTNAEAQPLTPGFPAAQAAERRAPQSADAAQAVNPGFTLDLAYETVWGMVNPGDRVTVTRSTGGAAYGAAEADGVGFFWTPLWQSDGQPADVAGGDTVEVYVNGALDTTLSPLDITGQVDVLNDQVTGNVSGLAMGTSVTVTLGGFGQMVAGTVRREGNPDIGSTFQEIQPGDLLFSCQNGIAPFRFIDHHDDGSWKIPGSAAKDE